LCLQDLQQQMEHCDAKKDELQEGLVRLANKPASKSKQSQTKDFQSKLQQLKKAAKELQAETEAWEAVLSAWDALLPPADDQQQQQQQDGTCVQGSSSGFDADGLMAGMLAAAGMGPTPAAAAAVGVEAVPVVDGDAWLGPGLDELLFGEGSDDDEAGDDVGDVLDAEFEQLDTPRR
jgi:hypothetical protein